MKPGPSRPAEKLSRTRQRQKLIDACISALYLHGPSRTTIDKVVSIADMSPGIVNFYFDTKASLLLSALESLAVEFEERVLAPVEAAREQPVEALQMLIDLYLDPELASPRKVSVWYSFWGEASSRREYQDICGQRDVAFAQLVQDLVARLIAQSGAAHLDAEAIALGLIGALEIMWQEIAFQTEADIDRHGARRRCQAYLRSVFPQHFANAQPARAIPAAAPTALPGWAYDDAAVFAAERTALFHRGWQWLAHKADLPAPGDYVSAELAGEPVFAIRGTTGHAKVFRNACARRPHAVVPHRSGNAGAAIDCGVDGYRYGLDGTSLDRFHDGLAEFPALCEQQLLFVKCADAESNGAMTALSSQMQLDGLAPFTGWSWMECRADWKVVVEHWADAYLAPHANTRTAGLGQAAEHELSEEPSGLVWRTTADGAGAGWSATRYASLLRRIGKKHTAPAWIRQLLWPNLLIEARPDGATIRQVLPLAPGRCAIRSRQYWHAEAGRIERAMSALALRLGAAWAKQDAWVMASTQIGLTAPGEPYRTTPDLPASPFWLWLLRRLPTLYVSPAGMPR